MKIKKSRNKNTKKIIIILAVIVVAIGSYLAYSITMKQHNGDESAHQIVTDIPTPKNKSDSDIKTEESIKDTNTDHTSPVVVNPETKLRQLQLSVSADVSKSTLFIRGGINNSVEFNGTCYAILTGPNGESIKKETTLLQNASTTDCMTIQVPLNDLSSGKWSVALNYTSSESVGASNAYTIEI